MNPLERLLLPLNSRAEIKAYLKWPFWRPSSTAGHLTRLTAEKAFELIMRVGTVPARLTETCRVARCDKFQ
jgi:hypothetical protein